MALRPVAMRILIAATPTLALLIITADGGDGGNGTRPSLAQQPIPPSVRYQAHISAGGDPPPAGSLSNPFKGDAKSVEAGEKLFAAFNCDGCHGGGAVGFVAPSLADGRWRYGGADGEVFHSIYYGRPRGMPAFGGILPPDAIWKLVMYLQSLEPTGDVSSVSW